MIRKWLLIMCLPFINIAATKVCRLMSCRRDTLNEMVCGSDGFMYPSRCHLKRLRCLIPTLQLEKRRMCRPLKPCQDWSSSPFLNTGNFTPPTFTPQCNGTTYASTQCHPLLAGCCWQVTPLGMPLSYSMNQCCIRAHPDCGGSTVAPASGRNVKPCKLQDRLQFNAKLMSFFRMEMYNWLQDRHYNETYLIQWKFRKIDRNNDGYLTHTEFIDVKRIIRRNITPKRCVRQFPLYCDENHDERVTELEWTQCLLTRHPDDNVAEDDDVGPMNYDEDDTAQPLPQGAVFKTALIGQYDDDVSAETRDDDVSDCLSERKNALMEGHQVYVPECTPDGRYKKVQCYKAAGYCFCVNEDTGSNIAGTMVKNSTAKCDVTSTTSPCIVKACPEKKRQIFLKNFLIFLKDQILSSQNVTYPQCNSGTTSEIGRPLLLYTKEEQIATRSFWKLDRNCNKALDRNEWKTIKKSMSTFKDLRKCGRKLRCYCDINKDRRINLTEWLDCLYIKQKGGNSSTLNISALSSRAGKKNPLSMLIED